VCFLLESLEGVESALEARAYNVFLRAWGVCAAC